MERPINFSIIWSKDGKWTFEKKVWEAVSSLRSNEKQSIKAYNLKFEFNSLRTSVSLKDLNRTLKEEKVGGKVSYFTKLVEEEILELSLFAQVVEVSSHLVRGI